MLVVSKFVVVAAVPCGIITILFNSPLVVWDWLVSCCTFVAFLSLQFRTVSIVLVSGISRC